MASKVNDDRLMVNYDDREVVHKRGNQDRPFVKYDQPFIGYIGRKNYMAIKVNYDRPTVNYDRPKK